MFEALHVVEGVDFHVFAKYLDCIVTTCPIERRHHRNLDGDFDINKDMEILANPEYCPAGRRRSRQPSN